MTPYRDRRQAGYYTLGNVKTTKIESTTSANVTGLGTPATPAAEATPVLDPDQTTLAELRDQAEALGLPTYGTKAEIAKRIKDAQ